MRPLTCPYSNVMASSCIRNLRRTRWFVSKASLVLFSVANTLQGSSELEQLQEAHYSRDCHGIVRSPAAADWTSCLFDTSRYFMFTAITTITVPSFPDLQTQYNADLGQINWTVAIPALGLAVGMCIAYKHSYHHH